MGETVRTFVALKISQEIKDKLVGVVDEIKQFHVKASWPRIENLHLTLKFLGPTEEEKIDEVKRALDPVAQNQAPFSVSLTGLGGFPNSKKPRIVWMGVSQGKEEMVQLAAAVETALEPLGFNKEEREFHPHLTLGRIKFPKPNKELEAHFEKKSDSSFGEWKIGSLLFMKSTLHPEGAKYDVLHESNFKLN